MQARFRGYRCELPDKPNSHDLMRFQLSGLGRRNGVREGIIIPVGRLLIMHSAWDESRVSQGEKLR